MNVRLARTEGSFGGHTWTSKVAIEESKAAEDREGCDQGPAFITEEQGSSWTDYIFFGGQRIAKQTGASASTAPYWHTHQLGSARMVTNATRSVVEESDFYPGVYPERSRRGGERVITDTLNNQYKFTRSTRSARSGQAGHERDLETGLDHTWYRQYASNLGRWTSPRSSRRVATKRYGCGRLHSVVADPSL